jgi:hypothetical protein
MRHGGCQTTAGFRRGEFMYIPVPYSVETTDNITDMGTVFHFSQQHSLNPSFNALTPTKFINKSLTSSRDL